MIQQLLKNPHALCYKIPLGFHLPKGWMTVLSIYISLACKHFSKWILPQNYNNICCENYNNIVVTQKLVFFSHLGYTISLAEITKTISGTCLWHDGWLLQTVWRNDSPMPSATGHMAEDNSKWWMWVGSRFWCCHMKGEINVINIYVIIWSAQAGSLTQNT